VVEEIPGVVKLVPVPKLVPPSESEYQFIVPADAVASRVTVPVPQRLPGVVPVMVGTAFTVTVTAVLVELEHPSGLYASA